MTWLLVVTAAVGGLAVGSFLNVVIWRVPRGESVVRPRSACPACGQFIASRDNVPVLGWLLLRGRARCCGSPISPRYPLVEAATAVAFGLLAAWLGWSAALPAFLYLAAVSIALTLIDMDVRRLPDVIVLPSYPVAGLLLLVATWGTDRTAGDVLRAVGGGATLWAFYFALLLVYPSGMGFGDVKLAGVLGMYLGWLGWGQVIVGGFTGFLYGGLLGGALMLARVVNRKSMIPFGPFMLAGAWTGILVGGTIAHWYLQGMGLS